MKTEIQETKTQKIVLTDIKIGFIPLCLFITKAFIALLPAIILAVLIYLLFTGIFIAAITSGSKNTQSSEIQSTEQMAPENGIYSGNEKVYPWK